MVPAVVTERVPAYEVRDGVRESEDRPPHHLLDSDPVELVVVRLGKPPGELDLLGRKNVHREMVRLLKDG